MRGRDHAGVEQPKRAPVAITAPSRNPATPSATSETGRGGNERQNDVPRQRKQNSCPSSRGRTRQRRSASRLALRAGSGRASLGRIKQNSRDLVALVPIKQVRARSSEGGWKWARAGQFDAGALTLRLDRASRKNKNSKKNLRPMNPKHGAPQPRRDANRSEERA